VSAWIVSKKHIDYLVMIATAIDRCGASFEQRDHVGRTLWTENARSVAYRYRDAISPDVEHYEHTSPGIGAFDPVKGLKLIACYEYQSCEHPEWKDSDAKRICAQLRSTCINHLAGYDAAPWGI